MSLLLLATIANLYSHVVLQRDLALLVANDWESELATRNLVDVFDPAAMALDGVCAQPNELDISLRELWLELREGAKLGCADWCVVLWVREENNPAVADEVMKVDWPVSGFGIEVRCCVAQAEGTVTIGRTHGAGCRE